VLPWMYTSRDVYRLLVQEGASALTNTNSGSQERLWMPWSLKNLAMSAHESASDRRHRPTVDHMLGTADGSCSWRCEKNDGRDVAPFEMSFALITQNYLAGADPKSPLVSPVYADYPAVRSSQVRRCGAKVAYSCPVANNVVDSAQQARRHGLPRAQGNE
jgi:hypothetical protein